MSNKILIIDDDVDLAASIEAILTSEYKIIITYEGKSGIEKAKKETPNLILLDIELPDIDGFQVCRKLREDIETRFIPIIMLTGSRTHPADRITGLKIGADDYLLKPFESEELKVRIARLILRAKEYLSLNSLTHLPGSYNIEEESTRRINSGEKFAICYIDVDNFKSFNDYYGYARGDQVIQLLSKIIIGTLENFGNKSDFLGHIGGDDFILISQPEKIDLISKKIAETFDQKISEYYESRDREKGHITTYDRQWKAQNFPLMTLSLAIVTNEKREIKHYGKLVDVLIEIKKYAKSREEYKKSIIVRDRRQDFLDFSMKK